MAAVQKLFRFYFSGLIIIFCVLTTNAQNKNNIERQGDLGNNTFLNPILAGDYPDPSILRIGKDYYMTHSAFDYLPGLAILHSNDLVNWHPISYALTTYLGSVWAPDLCFYRNKYYIYFTVAKKGNFVVYATSPSGPWSNPIDLNIGQIDPGHIVDEKGQRWLFLSEGFRVKLSEDGLAVIPGSLEKVYNGWKFPQNWETDGFNLEGPKLKKIGEYYYWISAEGGTAGPASAHMAVIARSRSINGPWENAPDNPLIHTYNKSERWWAKGHASLIDDPKGKWWIVYHAYENGFVGLGRQTLLEPVTLTANGWLKAPSGTLIEKPMVKPVKSAELPIRSANLNQFRIGFDWKYYKIYDSTRARIHNGILSLKALGNSPHESAPLLFVAGTRKYEFSVKIIKDSSTVAGLLLFYNADFYVGTGFDSNSRYRWRKGAIKGNFPKVHGDELWLKIVNDNQIITGYFSSDGLHWEKEIWGMDISGYNHNTLYDFISVLPGLFAYGKGNVEFSNFKFKAL